MNTLLISADVADYSLLLDSSTPGQRLPSLQANTVDSIKLASLALILSNHSLDDESVIAYMGKFQQINPDSENGPWLEVVPDDLLQALLATSPNQHSSIAERLIQIEEAVMDRWELAPTTEFIQNLVRFAQENVQGSKKLVLLTSI